MSKFLLNPVGVQCKIAANIPPVIPMAIQIKPLSGYSDAQVPKVDGYGETQTRAERKIKDKKSFKIVLLHQAIMRFVDCRKGLDF